MLNDRIRQRARRRAVARGPYRLLRYALFSIGAPTLLPHSVHEPS